MASTNFDIPLYYPTSDYYLKSQLDRLGHGVRSFIDQAAQNFAPRLLPKNSNSAALSYGIALSVTTLSTDAVNLALPRPNTQDGGKTLAVYRTASAGSITLNAVDSLVDGQASITLPTTVALYVFFFDGVNFYSQCCAEASSSSSVSDAEYLVAASHAGLSAERVATNTTTIAWQFSNPSIFGAEVPTFTSSTPGVVPASGGGTTNFLRADGTWAAPAAGGGGGGAPIDALYLVATGNATLTSERVAANTASVIFDFTTPNQFSANVGSGVFAPQDARYMVTASHGALSQETVPTNTTTVAWTTTNPTTFGAEVPTFTSSTPGVVPGSGGGTTNFLRADGTWAAPGGGSVASGAFAPADANYLTVHTGHAALSNERIFSIGSGAIATQNPARFLRASDGGVGSFYTLQIYPSRRYVDLTDDFAGGDSTRAGDLGWVTGAAGAGAQVNRQTANPTGHPGTFVLTTGAITGTSQASIGLGATGGSFDLRKVDEFEFITRIPTVTSSYTWEAKLGDSVGSFGGQNSIGFEYIPTSTRLMFNVRVNGANTYATGPGASGGAWVVLRGEKTPVGTGTSGWNFYVNDTLSQTINLNPNIRVSPMMYIKATNSSAKSTEIDRFSLSMTDLGLRYSNQ